MSKRMLIVEDEETLKESLKRLFVKDGFTVETSGSAERALEMLEVNLYDILVTDIILPGMDGIEMLTRVRAQNQEQICIVITAYASLETAIKALKAGAYDYIMKPILHEEMRQVIRNALRQKSLLAENTLLKRQIQRQYDFGNIIGRSPALLGLISQVKKIADARSNVLLLGETGTGKELIARAIHFNSGRSDKPFIPINCSAIPDNLLESEFFGHVKGAFTGAIVSKKGLFEAANGGTVFLDEIGDLSPALQSKLLRVLEDQEIRPVGGTQSVKVDLRFISATNRDIESEMKAGRFREDLFYRINVLGINLPPLRERTEDIEPLVRHFIKKCSNESNKNIEGIRPEALQSLLKYAFPGNIRELQNIIERAVLISESGFIGPEHLPEGMKSRESFAGDAFGKRLSIEDYTKAFILRFQAECTEQELADMLGITRKALWEKRKRWSLAK